MKKIIAAATLAIAVAGCSATPPEAPAVAKPVPAQDQTDIAIIFTEMAQTNIECVPYLPAKTWQEMLLPPVPNKDPRCYR